MRTSQEYSRELVCVSDWHCSAILIISKSIKMPPFSEVQIQCRVDDDGTCDLYPGMIEYWSKSPAAADITVFRGELDEECTIPGKWSFYF